MRRSELERWRDAETVLGALSVGYLTRLVQFGFSLARAAVLPWSEFCRVYDQARYVAAAWG